MSPLPKPARLPRGGPCNRPLFVLFLSYFHLVEFRVEYFDRSFRRRDTDSGFWRGRGPAGGSFPAGQHHWRSADGLGSRLFEDVPDSSDVAGIVGVKGEEEAAFFYSFFVILRVAVTNTQADQGAGDPGGGGSTQGGFNRPGGNNRAGSRNGECADA